MLRSTLLSVTLMSATVAAAQSPAPDASRLLTAEKMWALKRLGDPSITPDGKTAVLPVTTYDVKENKGLTDLWLIPVAGGPARQLTSDKASDNQQTVSPDGKWIAFVSKRGDDKESQIYVIAVDGGEARRVTNVPTGASVPKWFPDSTRLAFVSEVWPDLVRWEDQEARKKEREDSKMTARVWTRSPISYFDHYLDDTEPHLFSIPLAGGEPAAITRMSGYHLSRQEYDDTSFDISPDGLEFAFAAETDKTGIDSNVDIILLEACGCKPPRDITEASKSDDDMPRYSPDGRRLAFTQKRIKRFYADRSRLMMFDRAAGTTVGLTENWDRSVASLVWERDSRSLLSAIDDAGTRRVYRFRLDGGVPSRADESLDVRRAGAVGQRQGDWSRSARASPSRRRSCPLRCAPAPRPSSPRSTTKRSRASTRARSKASPTRARRTRTSRCGSSIHPDSTRRRNTRR